MVELDDWRILRERKWDWHDANLVVRPYVDAVIARLRAAEAEVARLTQARDAALAMAAGHEETAIMQRRAIVALTQAARQVPPASDAASSVFDQAKCNTHADYTQESANPEVARLTAKLGANHD